MRWSQNLFVCLVFCAAVFCAGCTQDMPPSAPVTPVMGSAPGLDPATLALTQSDVPPDFSPAGSRAKTSTEVSKLALELGWQDGYVARFIRPARQVEGEIEIVQSIAIYPERTMTDVIALAEQQARSDRTRVYTGIMVPGLGKNARAFYGKAGSGILINPTQPNPVRDGLNTNEVQEIPKTDVAEIIFSKGTIFEVVKMTGPSPDTTLLVSLAEKAYAKIP